jgi:chromosomal replication initiator protein
MTELERYSERINIPVLEILGKTRKMEIVTARQVYWLYLNRNKIGISEIGRMFNKDHSTVLSGIRRVNDLISVKDKYLKRYLEAIEYELFA